MAFRFDKTAILALRTPDYIWRVNCAQVYAICRSYVVWKQIRETMREKPDNEPWWEHWIGNPDTYHLTWLERTPSEYDARAEALAQELLSFLNRGYSFSQINDLTTRLDAMSRETWDNQIIYRKKLAQVQRKNAESVDGAVRQIETAIEGLKIFRDGAPTVIVVLATLPVSLLGGVSAGAAVGFTTLASAMAGYSKYDDLISDPEGNKLSNGRKFGAAAMTAGGTLFFGLAPISGLGGRLASNPKALLVVQASWNGATALVEGKTWQSAAMTTGTSLVSEPMMDGLLKQRWAARLLQKFSLPFGVIARNWDERVTEAAIKNVVKAGGSMAVDRVGQAAIGLVRPDREDKKQTADTGFGAVPGIARSAVQPFYRSNAAFRPAGP